MRFFICLQYHPSRIAYGLKVNYTIQIMLTLQHKNQGFTIVELLIVIVVIAILAAISLVSYNNIQSRATNASVISAAKSTITLINAYKAQYSNYPSLGAFCATADNTCTTYLGGVVTSDNTHWMNELRKIGTPVREVPSFDSSRYGLYLDLYAPRTFNHNPVPGLLMYYLKGQNQDCGVQNVAGIDPNPLPGEQNAYRTAPTPYTSSTSSYTSCWISV